MLRGSAAWRQFVPCEKLYGPVPHLYRGLPAKTMPSWSDRWRSIVCL